MQKILQIAAHIYWIFTECYRVMWFKVHFALPHENFSNGLDQTNTILKTVTDISEMLRNDYKL